MGCLQKYAVFTGRARRQEFWTFALCNMIIGVIPCIGMLAGILTIVPSIAVGVRRLHDTNRSGKWMFLALAPVFGIMIGFGLFAAVAGHGRGGSTVGFILSVPIVLVSIGAAIMLLVWAAQDGTRGDNKYGPDPKAASAVAAAATPAAPAAVATPAAVAAPATVAAPAEGQAGQAGE